MKFATPSRPEVRDEWVYISTAPVRLIEVDTNKFALNSIFVVPSIMLYSSEISPTRCNNCVFYSPQWLYSTCFGRQSHPSSGVHKLYMATGKPVHLGLSFCQMCQ